MRILTLNLKQFNRLYNDDDFWDYIKRVNPDIAFIQEARCNRFAGNRTDYEPVFPAGYGSESDGRDRITVCLRKKDVTLSKVKYNAGDHSFRIVKRRITKSGKTISGIHLPIDEDDKEKWRKLTRACKADIICGDFNANLKKTGTMNVLFLEKLKKSHDNLWDKGITEGKAYYISFGKERKAEKNNTHSKDPINYNTFSWKTRIDYILGKKNTVKLEKIILDFRTYAFTDHAALIADVSFYEPRTI